MPGRINSQVGEEDSDYNIDNTEMDLEFNCKFKWHFQDANVMVIVIIMSLCHFCPVEVAVLLCKE